MDLTFATHSEHKVSDCIRWCEFYKACLAEKSIKDNKIMDMSIVPVEEYITLNESGFTARDNAVQKAREAYNVLQKPCFAEDTAFYIHALGGPGCFFHRMMEEFRRGVAMDHEEKVKFDIEHIPLLLSEMGVKNRAVTASTIFAFYDGNDMKCFSASMNGTVAFAASSRGYMFDKIFVPDLETLPVPESRDEIAYASRQAFVDAYTGRVFGELPLAVMDAISFKRMAFLQMMCYIEETFNASKEPVEITG